MPNNAVHILLTGATGYIGGSVLTKLLSHSLFSTFQITVLVRDPAKAKAFEPLGVKPVIGSYSDHSLLQRLASEADVVFACVDANDLAAAKAILAGLDDRFRATGTVPSLIHTSGTGVIVDNAEGMHSDCTVYSDLDTDLETLSPSQPHRDIDLAVVQADTEGYVKTYLVLPCTIYGIAVGPLVDLGLQHAHAHRIPTLVKIGVERDQGGVIGLGKNIWSHVHISDVADLYILIFDKIQSVAPVGHGRTGLYFCENGEYVMQDLAATITRALHARGKSTTPTPTAFTVEEIQRYFPQGTMFGANSRCKAERSRAIGWRPTKEPREFLVSVEAEMPN